MRRSRGPRRHLAGAIVLSAGLLAAGVTAAILAFLAMGAGAAPAPTPTPTLVLHFTCIAGTDICRAELCDGARCRAVTPPPS